MKKVLLSNILLFAMSGLYAQNNTVAAGGNATGSGGSVSYSVGQVAYSFVSGGTSGNIIQGVQQPVEISVVTSINNIESNISVDIYPNPTAGKLIIQVGETNYKQMTYQLLTLDGRVIRQNQINNQSAEQIDISSLPSATYFIKIQSKQKQLKLYKVIKNN